MGVIQSGPFIRRAGFGGEGRGGGGGVPFGIPTSGLALYVNSTLEMGAYSQGSNVSPWPDQSGNNRDLVRLSPSQFTTFRVTDTSCPSGAPSVRFSKPGANANPVRLELGGIPPLGQANGRTLVTWIRSLSSPTVPRSIWNQEAGHRPEVYYSSGGEVNQIHINEQSGGGDNDTNYVLPQEPTMLAVRWTPPAGGAGLRQLYATSTSDDSILPIQRYSAANWSWNDALTNTFVLGIFESAANFYQGYDLGMFALWSRALTDTELLGTFIYMSVIFGL